MQRAWYALVRESVCSGAHATHARVELAYGGSHASGARDGVAAARCLNVVDPVDGC